MWRREVVWFTLACVVVTGVLLVGNNHWGRHVERATTGGQSTGPDYSHVPATWVGRAACAECHAAADTMWTGSDHDLAMQIPGPETVTADFDGATFTHFGVASTFTRRGHKYLVRTDGPDGAPTDFEIAYVFGYEPLEQFLIRFPDGRLQALNVCWDSTPADQGGQRWFHLYPDHETPAHDLFHWTGMLQNWNYMCAECHSTNLRRNYNEQDDTYDTIWSELNVSCEACHGPGSRHITWERAQARGLRPRDESGSRGLVVNLKSPDRGMWAFEPDKNTAVRTEPLASRVEIESCARCHARRAPITLDYDYGRPFLDHYRLILLDENLYAADGQNQDEVYVYGSFLQSKMYAAGVTCSDCHDYHSTGTLGQGNGVCSKCHRAEVYDTPKHHFHQLGKGGDGCSDCHQQARKVMVVDPRRDHSFRIPRPDLSLELGTPNACSDCHTDKTVQWSQDTIVKWYGEDRQQGPHFAVALHAGRTGAPGALDRLRFLIGAPDQPGIAKATALSLVPRFAAASEVPEAIRALGHDDPLVRGAAVRAMASSPAERQLTLVLPLLQDDVRDVRVAAAGMVATLPASLADPTADPAVARAHDIWRDYLMSNRDRPESQLGLADLHAHQGENSAAEERFRRALVIEPRYSPAYVNFADFLRRTQRPQAAIDVLREGVMTATDPADIHHSLGLLLVSQGDMDGALAELGKAVSQRPEDARFSYVYAVALHDAGQVESSLQVLGDLLTKRPWDRDCLQTLVLYALENDRPELAIDPAERLVKLNPGNAQLQSLLARARAGAQE
ncbi:hypothetical protein DRQ50_06005 [bacterium]|nr:MAG: hypothetical protein DRQ50_06005 [bacterium]